MLTRCSPLSLSLFLARSFMLVMFRQIIWRCSKSGENFPCVWTQHGAAGFRGKRPWPPPTRRAHILDFVPEIAQRVVSFLFFCSHSLGDVSLALSRPPVLVLPYMAMLGCAVPVPGSSAPVEMLQMSRTLLEKVQLAIPVTHNSCVQSEVRANGLWQAE